MISGSVIFLSFLTNHSTAQAAVIDFATGGPTKATANLIIDGINLGLNGANAGAGVILNRPWVFMFADGTPAGQVFRSAVAPPGGIATNTARSAGFLGTGFSTATANGAPGGFLATFASTRGIASANALAGIGTTGISAFPFTTALKMHLATIVVDPLNEPDSPVSQSPPPNPDTFSPFEPAFIPASTNVDAYLVNELGELVSLFHLEASLGFNSSSGRFDDLNLEVTCPNCTSSSLITESDFSFFDEPDGFGYRLDDKDIEIPYSLPTGWENLEFSAALEAQQNAASSVFVPVPEPSSTLGLLALGTLGAASTLKRKQKPSKSIEKELKKVS